MPYDVLPLPEPVTTARSSTLPDPTLQDPTLRELMREVAQPVAVVSGTAGNGDPDTLAGDRGPLAMTVSSVTSVSLDPPLVLFCPSRGSRTWTALAPTGRFVLNVLTDHQRDVAALFGGRAGAGQTGRDDRRPATAVRWTSLGGLPALACSAATATCHVVAVHTGGDHDIVVAAVDQVVVAAVQPVAPARARGPLSYWRGGYATVRTVGQGSSC